jgi:hypothetical protein
MSEQGPAGSRRLPSIRAGALTAIAFAGAAAAGVAEAAPVEQAVEVPMRAHASYFSERCIALQARDRLTFTVETAHAVDFNVHHHTDSATEYPVRRRVDDLFTQTIVAAGGGEYCFMWTNPERRPGPFTIRLHYAVDGA